MKEKLSSRVHLEGCQCPSSLQHPRYPTVVVSQVWRRPSLCFLAKFYCGARNRFPKRQYNFLELCTEVLCLEVLSYFDSHDPSKRKLHEIQTTTKFWLMAETALLMADWSALLLSTLIFARPLVLSLWISVVTSVQPVTWKFGLENIIWGG